VSERKRVEAQLVRSQQQIAEALRIAQIGNWEWDIQHNIVTWSDEMYEIFGVTPETFTATLEGYLERIHPDDRPKLAQDHRASVPGDVAVRG
jgi:PAS domain-containing protein